VPVKKLRDARSRRYITAHTRHISRSPGSGTRQAIFQGESVMNRKRVFAAAATILALAAMRMERGAGVAQAQHNGQVAEV
jgi:hypothetical protein